MDFKKELMNKALQMMQDPRVAKAMQNPTFINGVMGAIKLKGEAEKNLEAGMKLVAKSLNLATESEVRELKRAIKRLERELEAKSGAASRGKERTAD